MGGKSNQEYPRVRKPLQSAIVPGKIEAGGSTLKILTFSAQP